MLHSLSRALRLRTPHCDLAASTDGLHCDPLPVCLRAVPEAVAGFIIQFGSRSSPYLSEFMVGRFLVAVQCVLYAQVDKVMWQH